MPTQDLDFLVNDGDSSGISPKPVSAITRIKNTGEIKYFIDEAGELPTLYEKSAIPSGHSTSYRQWLNEISEVLGLAFSELSNASEADFVIAETVSLRDYDVDFDPSGRANHIYSSVDAKPHVYLRSIADQPSKRTFIHEMGHLLGLEHRWEVQDGDQHPSINASSRGSDFVMDYNNNATFFNETERQALNILWSGNSLNVNEKVLEAKRYSWRIQDPEQFTGDLIIGSPENISVVYEVDLDRGFVSLDMGGGADMADVRFNSRKKGLQGQVHVIKNFDQSEGDRIGIHRSVGQKRSFSIAKNRRDERKAFTSADELIYGQQSQTLYYNANGNQKGLGRSGRPLLYFETPESSIDSTAFTFHGKPWVLNGPSDLYGFL
jgi:hypothetical protein